MALLAGSAYSQAWIPQQSGTTASLRGVSVVNSTVVWASGAKGTYLRTRDGGATWETRVVRGAADMDFRDVEAFDERTAILLSSGPGAESRLYKTRDGGANWSLVFTNPDSKGFWDAMAFRDPMHGIVVGDPVDGRFVILTTSDGGDSWQRQKGPSAMSDEGAFAASGSCITVRGAHEAWFGTGGPGGGRVFHSTDDGKSWSVSKSVLPAGTTSGVFSLAFSDGMHGIVAGGDYKMDGDSRGTLAFTQDGGKTWTASSSPTGFKSAIQYLPDVKMWITVGTPASESSTDGGKTWKSFGKGFNAVDFASGPVGWAVGPGGSIAKFSLNE
jgi:photosystem II stability/assembly factor-like uncharacterized protein